MQPKRKRATMGSDDRRRLLFALRNCDVRCARIFASGRVRKCCTFSTLTEIFVVFDPGIKPKSLSRKGAGRLARVAIVAGSIY